MRMASHCSPIAASAASTVAENSSQLLNPGVMTARCVEAGRQVSLRRRVELLPQLGGRAEHRLREEAAIDHGLAALVEVEVVGRFRIDALRDRGARQFAIALLQVALRSGVEGRLQPRRDPGEQPSERFEVRVLARAPRDCP